MVTIFYRCVQRVFSQGKFMHSLSRRGKVVKNYIKKLHGRISFDCLQLEMCDPINSLHSLVLAKQTRSGNLNIYTQRNVSNRKPFIPSEQLFYSNFYTKKQKHISATKNTSLSNTIKKIREKASKRGYNCYLL